MADSSKSIKRLCELKRENELLQQELNALQMTDVDYVLKINRLENVLNNVRSVLKDDIGKLVEGSDCLVNVFNVLQRHSGGQVAPQTPPVAAPVSSTAQNTSLPKTVPPSPDKAKNAHVVNPHMVNGHVLYIPTINLTRVPESHTSKVENTSPEPEPMEANSPTARSTSEEMIESEENDLTQDIRSTSQISHLEEISEASSSKSPSHSTVLSGTFREVKIYLNQVTPDSVVDEHRSRRVKSRHGGSCSGVTKRRK